MASYSLTDAQEDDFKYSTGKSFKAWLDESLPAWAESAKVNRRKKLLELTPSMTDEKVKELLTLVNKA